MGLMINRVILGILLSVVGVQVVSWPLVTFPIALLDLILLTTGLSLLLAPLHVRYHDVGYLWTVLLQIGFWLTPILYFDRLIPERYRWILTFDPMMRIITQSREAVVYQGWPDGVAKLQTFLFTPFVMLAASCTFRRIQARLA